MSEITFILEPDCGRVTVETSSIETEIVSEIKQFLGKGTTLNCARPSQNFELKKDEETFASDHKSQTIHSERQNSHQHIHLFRLYHHSTVDGPGKRNVVQVAGCSIRCQGCYVPETHERANGKLTPIEDIIAEIDKRSGEHDGVTILGGEPFDQVESLEILVEKLKEKGYHLVIYSGYTLEDLLARKGKRITRILANTDLLIDGAFKRELTANAGEYRGSSNQRMILHPVLRLKT